MKIRASHPRIGEPQTYVTASASAAATALTVASNGGFTAADYTVIGKPGIEESTINKISTVASTTTINYVGDALAYGITQYTPVSFIKYNQVKFYLGDYSSKYNTGTVSIENGSAILTGSGTSWGSITTLYALLLNGKWYDIKSIDSTTQITLTKAFEDESLEGQSYELIPFALQGSAVAITISQNETVWDDTDGIAEDYYRYSYYNSTTTVESNKSAPISGASLLSIFEDMEYEDSSLGAILEDVYNDLEVGEDKLSRKFLISKVNDAVTILSNAIISSVHEDYGNAYGTINLKNGVGEYPLPSGFKKLSSIWIAYSGSSYKQAQSMNIAQDNPDAQYVASEPYYYLRNNMIGIRPEPIGDNTDGIKLWSIIRPIILKVESDKLPDHLKDYKVTIIEYVKWKACLRPGIRDIALASECKNNFLDSRKLMLSELQDRDLSSNKIVEIIVDYDLYD